MEKTVLIIWHNGDRSVGIWGQTARLELDGHYDKDDLQDIQEMIKETFTDIWDFQTYVMDEKAFEKEMRES